jgi:argininosuccinate lyase
MARFSDPQDPLFQALNSSIAFDYRLAPYDLEQSIAHARMLAREGIIGDEDLAEIERGLGEVRREIEEDRFEIHPADEDVHMAIERRLTEIIGPVGGKLHTAPRAPATTRSPRTWRCSCAPTAWARRS